MIGGIAGSIIGKQVPFNLNILEKLTGTYTFSSMKIQKELGFKPISMEEGVKLILSKAQS